ncbi:MAG: hypothetical protein ACREWG_12440 [Gammaproteobacteria bacterium]
MEEGMEITKHVLRALAAGYLTAGSWATAAAAGQCDFQHVFTRPDENGAATVKVFEAKVVSPPSGTRPLLFITSLKVNTDGTKISYHQDDPTGRRCETNPSARPCAINNIRNAYRDHKKPISDFTAIRDSGYPNPKTWQVLNPDIIEKNANTGKPCITLEGYLVSMTADFAVAGSGRRVGDCDQSKWIDALTAPAIVLPKDSEFRSFGVGKRSLVVAVSHSPANRTVFGIVGDIGPAKEIGEANVAMNRELNGLPADDQPKHRQDAIKRFQAGRSAILLFPGSDFVLDRPISGVRIAAAGADALAKFGGAQKLIDCIHNEIDHGF